MHVYLLSEGGSLRPEVEVVGSSGKVFALQWLTVDQILILGTAGLMTTWEVQTKDKGKVAKHTLGGASTLLFLSDFDQCFLFSSFLTATSCAGNGKR